MKSKHSYDFLSQVRKTTFPKMSNFSKRLHCYVIEKIIFYYLTLTSSISFFFILDFHDSIHIRFTSSKYVGHIFDCVCVSLVTHGGVWRQGAVMNYEQSLKRVWKLISVSFRIHVDLPVSSWGELKPTQQQDNKPAIQPFTFTTGVGWECGCEEYSLIHSLWSSSSSEQKVAFCSQEQFTSRYSWSMPQCHSRGFS